MKKVLCIGEILNENILHSNAPLAIAYRKHIAEQKAESASDEPSTFSAYGG